MAEAYSPAMGAGGPLATATRAEDEAHMRAALSLAGCWLIIVSYCALLMTLE